MLIDHYCYCCYFALGSHHALAGPSPIPFSCYLAQEGVNNPVRVGVEVKWEWEWE